MHSLFVCGYSELSLLHVAGEIGDFFAEISGEVVESGIEQSEPSGNGYGAFLERSGEGEAVDEDRYLASLGVKRHRFGGDGEIGGDSF